LEKFVFMGRGKKTFQEGKKRVLYGRKACFRERGVAGKKGQWRVNEV